MQWPELGETFIERVGAEVAARTRKGWPAGFEPVGDPDADCDEERGLYSVDSNKRGGLHYYAVAVYPQFGKDCYALNLGWYSQSNAAIRKLENHDLLQQGTAIIAQRIFAQYFIEKEEDGHAAFYTMLAGDAATLLSPAFISEVVDILFALIEELTRLGVR